MDKTDYRGQRPGDVLAAMAKKANFNYYVRWHAGSAAPELVFRDDNAGTADTSTVTIVADTTANGTSIFAPHRDAQLTIDPENVYSDVYATYAKGVRTATRAATATAFVTRWGATDDSGIKTAASADDEATTFLWESHTEEHALSLTLRMRAAYVNLIRAGDRVPVTIPAWTQEGYGTATYCRVIRRRITQPLNTDNDYDVALDLVPQEDAPTAGAIVQSAFGSTADGGGTLTFSNPVTVGNLLVYCVSTSHDADPDAPNTSTALDNWGTAAWTRLPDTQIHTTYGTGGYGVAIWYKTADSTSQTGFTSEASAAIGIYEISGADIGSAGTAYANEQTVANPMTIGSLGTPVSGSVNILVGNWVDASIVVGGTTSQPTWDGSANGWTEDFLYTVPAVYPRWNPPVSYFAHQIGDGSAISASGTRSALQWLTGEWCGAAISIPPL